jgi:hypothetical protein
MVPCRAPGHSPNSMSSKTARVNAVSREELKILIFRCDETWGPQPGARQRRRSRLVGSPVTGGVSQAAWPEAGADGCEPGGGLPSPGPVSMT